MKNFIKKKFKLKSLEKININAAGIDIGSKEIVVAVPEERDKEFIKTFGTFTDDLLDMADWLKKCP